jgi:predicted Co/Zn/Cd cation transporter (cation efflux family)
LRDGVFCRIKGGRLVKFAIAIVFVMLVVKGNVIEWGKTKMRKNKRVPLSDRVLLLITEQFMVICYKFHVVAFLAFHVAWWFFITVGGLTINRIKI